MTPQIAIGISAVLGAFVFIAAGYLLARLRSAPATTAVDLSGAEEDRAELGQVKAELARTTAELESARTRERRVVEQLGAAKRVALASQEQLALQQPVDPQALGEALAAIETLKEQLRAHQAKRDQAEQTMATLQQEARANAIRVQAAEEAASALRMQSKRAQTEQDTTLRNLAGQLQAAEQELEGALERERAAGAVAAELRHSLATTGDQQRLLEQDRQQRAAAQQQLADYKARLDRQLEERTKIEQTVKSSQAQLEAERAVKRSLEQELAEYRARVAQMEGKLSELQRIEAEREHLRQANQELERSQVRLQALEQVAADRDELALRIGMYRDLEQRAERLHEEKASLSDELNQLLAEKHTLEARVAQLSVADAERADLAIQLGVLERRVSDFDALLAENTELKVRSTEIVHLQQENQQMRAELAQLSSLEIVRKRKEHRPEEPAQHVLRGIGSLQNVVERVASSDTVRSAVLADPLGLVVAAAGNHTEALAAVAAILNSVADKAQTLLPMSEIYQMTVSDDNSLTFTARPVSFEHEPLLLVTLTAGPCPTHDTASLGLAARP